jgi:hypothetical protein
MELDGRNASTNATVSGGLSKGTPGFNLPGMG